MLDGVVDTETGKEGMLFSASERVRGSVFKKSGGDEGDEATGEAGATKGDAIIFSGGSDVLKRARPGKMGSLR